MSKMELKDHIQLAKCFIDADMLVKDMSSATSAIAKSKRKQLVTAEKALSNFKHDMEELMFEEHPYLSDEWLGIYYGDASEREARIEQFSKET